MNGVQFIESIKKKVHQFESGKLENWKIGKLGNWEIGKLFTTTTNF